LNVTTFHDREFIRTDDDLYFCVVGELHPADRAFAYLRYAPSPEGKWSRGGRRFARAMPTYSVPNLLRNIESLKETHPEYVFRSDVFDVEMSAVPVERISKHYLPKDKLGALKEMKKPDPLQQMAVELAERITETIGIPSGSLGITGSILIDLHNPRFSDIDMTVAGVENGLRLKKVLPLLYSDEVSPLKSVTKPVL
jgi:predicted nucleotidyltransferase